MLSRRFFRVALFLGTAAAVTTGCPECAPDRVAVGVAQLTVRNVGAMVSLVNADTECGFGSDGVLGAAVADGAVGSEGTLTFTVTDCVIDLGSSPVEVSEDCAGNTTTATGKVTISATRQIGGLLTGDADTPIIPGGPDSVTITLTSATFENFEVKSSSSDSFLTMIEGSLGATVKPRLAVDVDQQACSVATPNVTFTSVAYEPSTLHVTTPDNSFDVGVATSNLSAQNGKGPGGDENIIAGDITVFDSPQTLAEQALDPEFDAAKFAEGYTCAETGLFLTDGVESYTCPNLNPLLADGAARLTVKMLGTVAGLIDADTTCGFSSAAVQEAGAIDGTPGAEGSLTLTVTDCVIAFTDTTSLSEDCNGDATTVSGSVSVSGTKTVSGRFTGNPASPIVPITDQPADIALTIVTTDFSVGSTADVNTLLARSGTLTGTVSPKVFIGAETGVCSVSSPNAGFDDVTWADADLLLTSASGTFALDVDSASLEAANGTSGSGTNELTGTVTLDGEAFTVPADGAGLNPEFSQAELDASFTCDPELAQPLSDACEATLDATIAPGIAALTVRTFGTAVSLIDANTVCGFSAPAVAGTPTFVGDLGEPGSTATFTIAAGCTVTLPAEGAVVSTDCVGGTTTVAGTVTVTGTKTVTGWRTGDVFEPIVPDSGTPATFDLTLTFAEATPFTVTSSTSTATLTVRGGTLEGTVQPRVGLDLTTGACSIATPNVTFTDLTWTNAPVTLVSDGNAFTETVETSDIDAQNGNRGEGDPPNTIAGSITIGGTETTVAGPLDPAFDQEDFDATYTCAANGSPVLVPTAACSFRQALGVGAAALLVKAAATAVSVHDGNPICGFEADASPTPAPTGTPPAPGTLTFDAAAGCQSGFKADTTIATDCVGDETHASGGFATTAASTKVVAGLFTGLADPSFVPTARDSAVLTLPGIQFANWSVAATDSADVVDSRVTITSGTAGLVVNPITGRNAGASGALGTDVFTESTGIAQITDLVGDDLVMTIVSAGKTFNLTLTDVDLDAFAGAFFDGVAEVGSNDLSGTVTVNGELVNIAPGTPLNPAYDQAAFDATYTCNPVLGDPPDVVPSSAP
jgi:hypothetical protein